MHWKISSLFSMKGKEVSDEEEHALLHYIDCSSLLHDIKNRVWVCVLNGIVNAIWITHCVEKGWGVKDGFLGWDNGLKCSHLMLFKE